MEKKEKKQKNKSCDVFMNPGTKKRGILLNQPNPITGKKQTALKLSTNPGEPIWENLQRFRDGIAARARALRGPRNADVRTEKVSIFFKNSPARQHITSQKQVEVSIRNQVGEKYYIKQDRMRKPKQ
jgi:hypothetical protein